MTLRCQRGTGVVSASTLPVQFHILTTVQYHVPALHQSRTGLAPLQHRSFTSAMPTQSHDPHKIHTRVGPLNPPQPSATEDFACGRWLASDDFDQGVCATRLGLQPKVRAPPKTHDRTEHAHTAVIYEADCRTTTLSDRDGPNSGWRGRRGQCNRYEYEDWNPGLPTRSTFNEGPAKL